MSVKSSLDRFVVRYGIRQVFKNAKGETETAIVLTDKRTVCNDSEQIKYYAKIGGVLDFKDLTSLNAMNTLAKVDVYGYYLAMTNHRSFVGSDTYPIMIPNLKVPSPQESFGPLTSFIPRINGSNGEIICGMRIATDEMNRGRVWSRYVGSDKSNFQGFVELNMGYAYDKDYRFSAKRKYVGFYVGKNTSLLMYDIGSIIAAKEIANDQNRTLFQEGAFVYADADILFRLCGESEVKLYNCKELYDKLKDTNVIGSDRYKKPHIIREKDPKKRSIIIFLKTNPFVLPFQLVITNQLSKDSIFKNKRTIILNIPNGGEFEYCEYWQLKDGIKAVNERQSKQPWNKYIQRVTEGTNATFEDRIVDLPQLVSFPKEQNEKTPQNDDLYIKLRKARKGFTDKTPNASPNATSNASPNATSNASPNATSNATPEAAPDPTPENPNPTE